MTTFRIDGPTPQGGEYVMVTYVKTETLAEVDKADADGVMVTEYSHDGKWLGETIGAFTPPQDSMP